MKNFENDFFFQFFFVKKFFQVFQIFWIFDSLMFRIFLKWPNLKYFIWFVHSKLSKMKKKWKIFFQKKTEKKFFFVFFEFFISDWIYAPKIMTKKLSHVILSWSNRKKVCEMHILCILRHNFQKNCKKKFFLYFQNFSFLIGFIHPKPCPTICLMSYLHDYIRKKYVKCTPFAYQGI